MDEVLIQEMLVMIDGINHVYNEDANISAEDIEKLNTLIQFYILKYIDMTENGFFDYNEEDEDYLDKVFSSKEITGCVDALQILGYTIFRTYNYPDEIVSKIETIQEKNVSKELIGPVLSLNNYWIHVI